MRLILFCLTCVFLAGKLQAQTALLKSQVQLTAEDLVYKTKASYFTTRTSKVHALSAEPCAILLPCAQITLPVKLLAFSGVRTDDANVLLSWETTQEVNNDYFQVERTLNPVLGYQPVALVKGAGSSSATVKYKTTDPNNHSGYTYYRLKQVDFDGTFTYSSIVGVKGATVPLSITAFPNPGQSKHIAFEVTSLKVAGELAVVIYDVRGSVVYQHDNHRFSPEDKQVQFNLTGLSAGKYSIKITGKQDQASTSFVIIPQ